MNRDWIAYNIWFGYAYSCWYEKYRHTTPEEVVRPSASYVFTDRLCDANRRPEDGYYSHYYGSPDWNHHGPAGAVYGFADGHAATVKVDEAQVLYSEWPPNYTYFKLPK